MAVNITQKDETLRKVIHMVHDLRNSKANKPAYKLVEADRAYMRACDDIIDLCERLLGYSNPNMPVEVPNQSETAADARRMTL